MDGVVSYFKMIQEIQCKLPFIQAAYTIGQSLSHGQWAKLFVMPMLPLLPNINNSFKLLQFNIPQGRYNSKIESHFNNSKKWLHCLLFVVFALLLKAWSHHSNACTLLLPCDHKVHVFLFKVELLKLWLKQCISYWDERVNVWLFSPAFVPCSPNTFLCSEHIL